MEFTTSSFSRTRAGFTLAEAMVALGAGSLVLAAVMSLSLYTSRTLQTMVQYSQMEAENQRALDTLTQNIRNADRITAYSANQLSLLTQGQTLTYSYNAGNKRLTQTRGGTPTILLTNATSLNFTVYQRNIASNSFNQYLASGTNTAKAVIVTWISTETLNGTTQSETVRSARIVVRNNPS